jgi:putative peptidoglycan lipid II flippase
MFKLRILDDNFSIGKATVIIASLTVVSRIFGFILKLLLTRSFGAGDTLDIYLTAFRIPDILYNLLILGTLSAAFIPVFGDFLQKDKTEAYRVANGILNICLLVMSGIAIFLFIFAHPLTQLLVPGFGPEKLAATVSLTRILLLSPLLFTISNIFTGILSTYKRFFIVNIAPIFYNFGIIFGLLVLYPRYGLKGLGFGVLLGAVMHISVQIPELLRHGYSWQPVLLWRHQGVRKIFKLILPRVFGLDTSFVSLIVVSIIGSYLAAGSISIFSLAYDLLAFPVGIFAISVAIAAFPLLSELHNSKRDGEFVKTLQQSIEQILFFALPFTVMLLIFRAYIVRLAYGYGQFSWDDTRLTFTALGIFSFALFSQSLIPLLARSFYARYNTWIPVMVSLMSLIVNGLISYLLAPRIGVAGLAIGFAFSSIFNCLMLLGWLHHQFAKDPNIPAETLKEFDTSLIGTVFRAGVSSIPMGLVSYGALKLLGPLLDTHTVVGILLQAGIASIAGLIVYWFVGKFMKLKQIETFEGLAKNYWNKRFGRNKAVS